nr:MAG TPA: hypothetical protein [Caudoviricetes sp.]
MIKDKSTPPLVYFIVVPSHCDMVKSGRGEDKKRSST